MKKSNKSIIDKLFSLVFILKGIDQTLSMRFDKLKRLLGLAIVQLLNLNNLHLKLNIFL